MIYIVQRIILLLVGGQDLPEGLLSEDLRTYISLNTYLSTEDKYFWHRLR